MKWNLVLSANGVVRTLQDINKEMKELQKNASGIGNSNGMSRFAASYQSQLNQMKTKAEEFYMVWKKTGDLNAKAKFEGMIQPIRNMQKEMDGFSKAIGTSHSNMNLLAGSLDRMHSHASWLASGAFLAAAISAPLAVHKAFTDAEMQMNRIRQNMELIFRGKELEDNLKAIQNAAQVQSIAYAQPLEKILESYSLLSRRWKDSSSLVFLQDLVSTLSKIDSVDLVSTAQRLEAVALGFNLGAQGIKDFASSATYAVHSTNLRLTDLLDGLERSSVSFKSFNLSHRDAIALIGALTTVTARSGKQSAAQYGDIL